jgi:UDP-N-acetylglucosamine 3-dehydrogenase
LAARIDLAAGFSYPAKAEEALMIRIAISGAGAIASRAHIPAFKIVADAEIVAIQSRTMEKAAGVAETLWPNGESRPHVYDDFDAMLSRENPDAVLVLTPNRFHREYTLNAIAAGAHVLVEKPMAPNAADAQAMVDAAAGAKRVLMVAMQRRYGPLETIVKEALEAGAIGQPYFFRGRLSHGGPQTWAPGQSWFTDAGQAGGGATLDLGVHVADLARWYMGDVATVSGQVATIGKRIKVDDTGAMVLGFRSGAMGVIEASWSAYPPLSALEISGSEGRVMMGYPRLDIAIVRADGTSVPGYSREEIVARFDVRDLLAPFRSLAQNFIASIKGEAAPMPSGVDGLGAIEVIDACYRSSKTGARIALPLTD